MHTHKTLGFFHLNVYRYLWALQDATRRSVTRDTFLSWFWFIKRSKHFSNTLYWIQSGQLVYSCVLLHSFLKHFSVYVCCPLFTCLSRTWKDYSSWVWHLQAFASACQMCSLYPLGWGHVALPHLVEMHHKVPHYAFLTLALLFRAKALDYDMPASCGITCIT